MTINQIIQTFKQASEYLVEVNSFEFGDKYNQNQSNVKMYPQMFLETPLIYNRTNNAYIYNIGLQVLDRPVEDDNFINRRSETLSKCQQIGDQIIELLRLNLAQFNTQVLFNSGITILDEFADNLTGVRLEITLSTPLKVNWCEINQDPNFNTDLLDYLNFNQICP